MNSFTFDELKVDGFWATSSLYTSECNVEIEEEDCYFLFTFI